MGEGIVTDYLGNVPVKLNVETEGAGVVRVKVAANWSIRVDRDRATVRVNS
jgi:hypothetical protein